MRKYLTTEARLTSDPAVASSIPAWSHTDHETICTVILLFSADSSRSMVVSYKQSTGEPLVQEHCNQLEGITIPFQLLAATKKFLIVKIGSIFKLILNFGHV